MQKFQSANGIYETGINKIPSAGQLTMESVVLESVLLIRPLNIQIKGSGELSGVVAHNVSGFVEAMKG
jgi:hypothetical protein